MAIELIVNLLILFGSVFSYFYVEATMPVSPVNELGAEQWPQAIIILLVIALLFNIYRVFKEGRDGKLVSSFKSLGPDAAKFFKSKLFVGMMIALIMSFLYEPLGFMTTCLLFLVSYGFLLGERRWGRLVLFALIITTILYISFSVFLGVLLPRGDIPFLRNLALFVESIIPTF